MITLRRAKERRHTRGRRREVWRTFGSEDGADAPTDGFGTLGILQEDRLPAGGGTPRHLQRDAEIITYVREGALAHEDATGRSGVLYAGEFQLLSAGRGIRHSETNPSLTEGAHVFHVSLRPSESGLDPTYEQKRFSSAQRRGGLCAVASPDARRGSLRIHQDAIVYSSLLDPGQHVVHELAPGRSAWLHVVEGEVTLGDFVLAAGDGAGVTAERAVSLRAQEETEILLLDLAGLPESAPAQRRKPRPRKR